MFSDARISAKQEVAGQYRGATRSPEQAATSVSEAFAKKFRRDLLHVIFLIGFHVDEYLGLRAVTFKLHSEFLPNALYFELDPGFLKCRK